MLEVLKDHDGLVGAAVGAFAAFASAAWVARTARVREDRSAGMVLLACLGELHSTWRAHEESKNLDSMIEREPKGYLAFSLTRHMPPLPSLFDGSAARLMPIDTSLAVLVQTVETSHRLVRLILNELALDFDSLAKGETRRAPQQHESDVDFVYDRFKRLAIAAGLAQELIGILVMGRWRGIRRVGLRLGLVGSSNLQSVLRINRSAPKEFWNTLGKLSS